MYRGLSARVSITITAKKKTMKDVDKRGVLLCEEIDHLILQSLFLQIAPTKWSFWQIVTSQLYFEILHNNWMQAPWTDSKNVQYLEPCFFQ